MRGRAKRDSVGGVTGWNSIEQVRYLDERRTLMLGVRDSLDVSAHKDDTS
jgi:hypothetical protein